MSLITKSACVLAFLMATTAALPPALAGEPTAADAETALQLYTEGKQLREKGDNNGALEKLRAAYALVETPITAMELSRTYVVLGKLVEAREILLTVPRIPVRRNESQRATDARKEADGLAAELKPRLGSVLVRVRGPAQPPPKISVDGAVVPPEAATVPRIVNPGKHVVALEANGQTTHGEVTVAEGQAKEIALDVPTAKDTTPPAHPPPGPEPRRGLHPLVFAGFGTAIVGFGVGGVTGIMTLSKADDVKAECRDGRCPPASESDLDSSKTTATISTIGFIVGGVGVAAGVVGLVLSAGKSKPATPAAPARANATSRIDLSPTGIRGTF